MSFVRQVQLVNNNGKVYDVTTKSVLMTDLKGFGYSREETYRQIGHRFVRVNSKSKQENLEGTIHFNPPDPYIKFNEFAAFLAYEPIRIRYQPVDDYEFYLARGVFPKQPYIFYKDVSVVSVEKGELTKYGDLEIKIGMTPLSPWYRDLFVSSDVDVDAGLIWEESSTWTFNWENDTGKFVVIDSDSQIPSPCKLVIPGPAINPRWKHFVGGKLFAEGSVKCTVGGGHKLVISNIGDSPEIAVYNNSGTRLFDAYQDSDFMSKRFIEIQNGVNAIYVEDDNGNESNLQAEAMIYYEAV